MKIFFYIITFGLLCCTSNAQQVTLVSAGGNISITQDTLIKLLMDYTTTVASEKMTADGYRIQLTSSSNRSSVLTMKAQFTQLYPNTKAYIEYHQPSFKLRVGDFESRMAAYSFQQEILSAFPNGFIVQDKISLGEK